MAALEVAVRIGAADLILCTVRPKDCSRFGIPSQNVICYGETGEDDVSQLVKSLPAIPGPATARVKQVFLRGRLWLAVSILNLSELADWQTQFAAVVHLCVENHILRVVVVPPAAPLWEGYLSKGIPAIICNLEQVGRLSPLRVSLQVRKSQFSAARQVMETRGLATPVVGGMKLSELSLIRRTLAVLKCPYCQRVVQDPVFPTNCDSLACRFCVKAADSKQPCYDFGWVRELLQSLTVTCRCGAVVKSESLDRHTLECANKEFFCSDCGFSGRDDAFFDHLLEKHAAFVRDKARDYLNRD